MKPGKASRTAEITAAWRAIESREPENLRICFDPLARRFLGWTYITIVESGLLRRLWLWYVERSAPGMPGLVVARTRYIDDHLKKRIKEGIRQVVILGAGYDSRAYRVDDLKGRVRVFEVDVPATQKKKIAKVKRVYGSLPDHVVYVPIDFETQKIDQCLLNGGYDQEEKTLFILEGVATYLTAEAMDETLASVAGHSAGGSSIIFSYLFPEAVNETCEAGEAMAWRKGLTRRGEPPVFGLEENRLDAFLSERGYRQVYNVPMTSLKKAYFKGKNGKRQVFPWAGIAHATVEAPFRD